MKYQPYKKLSAHLLGMLIGASIAYPLNISAAPGGLADAPLFLTNKAEPNIFFMTDDSGSMDWEITTDESSGVMQYNGRTWRYVFDEPDNAYSDRYNIPTQENVDDPASGVWRARNHLYNKMYYNPALTYKPWSGVDNAGNTYNDAYTGSTWNTRRDPYLNGSSTVNLSVNMETDAEDSNGTDLDGNSGRPTHIFYPARYWVWDDSVAAGSDNDGVIDQDDSHTLIEIRSTTPVCANGLDASVTQQRTTTCMLRPYADEMKNFANWYTYSRRREYAAKSAMAKVVENSGNVRMGVATINSNTGSNSREALASMNSDITSGNKRDLTDAIFSIQSDDGTPLRSRLQRVGNYYAGSGTTPFGNGVLGLDTTVPPGATGTPAECSQNFAVLMTDGFYNGGDASSIGNDDSDNSSWTGDYDPENDGSTISQTFRFDEDPYQDTESDSLADVAMYYYERDLRPSTANKVPLRCGEDENPGQHMVTYTVAFGVKGTGTVDPDNLPAHPNRGYAANCAATTGSAYSWPDPDDGNAEKIDDLIHAAYNGRGEYLNATNPEELSSSLSEAFRSITSRIGAASGISFNTNSLNSNSRLYQASFNSTQWSGELESFALDAYANISTTPEWQSSPLLDARDLSANDRTIVTFSSNTGVAFRWADLDTTQQNDLRTDSGGVLETTTGYPKANARLDFIRGDRDCEIGASGTCSITKEFRARSSRLGDLVHSQPIYIGAPTQSFPDQAPFGVATEYYGDFKTGQASASAAFTSSKKADTRTPILYAGANDGMLHAFEAETGEEVFAYIPSMLFSAAAGEGLHALTEPTYNHKYYVDLSVTVSQAYINRGSGNNWHTILVGGLRGGGRGLYALDVTDPDAVIEASGTAKETAAKKMVMWEFTNADDPDLGYTFSKPAIVALGTKTGVKWYAVFGNGYNADTTNGADGKAYLFLVNLEGPTGSGNSWTEGTDYYKVATGVGGVATESDKNGLSTPVVLDLDRDKIYDRAYAGDLHGNLWAFDLSGNPSGSSGWSSAYKSGGTAKPLFYATDGNSGSGNKQPITTKPTVIRHPTVDLCDSGGCGSSNEPNLMIYFGTGQYLNAADLSSTSTQSFYAVWDKGQSQRTVHRSSPSSSHLVKKVFTATSPVIALSRAGGTEAVDYSSSSTYGWFYDLPETAERIATNPTVRGDIVFFNTLIPSLEPCGYGGSGWECGVQTKDGSSECGTFDTDGDGVISCPPDVSLACSKKIGAIPLENSFLAGGSSGSSSTSSSSSSSTSSSTSSSSSSTSSTSSSGGSTTSGGGSTTSGGGSTTSGGGSTTSSTSSSGGCPPGKKLLLKFTRRSDGSTTKKSACVDNDTHTGRFSWRELLF